VEFSVTWAWAEGRIGKKRRAKKTPRKRGVYFFVLSMTRLIAVSFRPGAGKSGDCCNRPSSVRSGVSRDHERL
jgi:hypothetical protein